MTLMRMIWSREYLNLIQEIFHGENCPECGILIQKDGGCSYVTCQGCQKQFCWDCLGFSTNHVHNDWTATFCPLRQQINFWLITSCVILIILKLCMTSSLLSQILTFLIYWILIIALAAVYLILIVVNFIAFFRNIQEVRSNKTYPFFNFMIVAIFILFWIRAPGIETFKLACTNLIMIISLGGFSAAILYFCF